MKAFPTQMVRASLAVVPFLLSAVVAGAERTVPIDWYESPETAFVAARNSNRPLLIYFASKSCGYCRMLEKQSWPDPAVSNSIASGFVALKVDGDAQEELVDRYRIVGFPTVILVSTTSNSSKRIEGYQNARNMARVLADFETRTRISKSSN